MQEHAYRRAPLLSIGVLTGALIAFAFLLSQGTAFAEHTYQTSLSGDREIPSVETMATGTFALTFDEDHSAADYTLEVFNGEDVTMAHLHCGTSTENGPPFAFIYGSSSNPGVDVNGQLSAGTLTDADILEDGEECDVTDIMSLNNAIASGTVYVNVHSVEHPSGLIRGQLNADIEEEEKFVDISVAAHICKETVQSVADFNALDENNDAQTTFFDKLVACPTVILPGDTYASGTVHFNEQRFFNFRIEDAQGTTTDILRAHFVERQICESESASIDIDAELMVVNQDINGDGDLSDCFDTSYYEYQNIRDGMVSVTETTMTPASVRAAALAFTPTSLMNNNDAETLEEDLDEVLSGNDSTIELNTTVDSDGSIMLHVFHFVVIDDDDNGDDDNGDNGNGGGGNGDDDDNGDNGNGDNGDDDNGGGDDVRDRIRERLETHQDRINMQLNEQQEQLNERLDEVRTRIDDRFDNLFEQF